MPPTLHAVHLYRTPADQLDVALAFLGPVVKRGGLAVVVAGPALRAGLASKLKGRVAYRDAAETLARFDDHGLDEEGFQATIADAMDDDGGGELAVYGDMVALLWRRGRTDEALALEAMWERMPGEFRLLCGYPARDVKREADVSVVCSAHAHVQT